MSEFTSLYIKTQVVNFALLYFVLKKLYFALKSCYNLRKRNCCILHQKVLQFGLMLHFASKVVTFSINVTCCLSCYTLQPNRT